MRPLRNPQFLTAAAITIVTVGLVACGGGGGGTPLPAQSLAPGPTPTLTPTPQRTSSAQAIVGYATQNVTLARLPSGYGATVSLPGTNNGVGASLNFTLSSSLLSSVPPVQSSRRVRESIGGTPQALAYVTIASNSTCVFPQFPAMTFMLPTAPAPGAVFGWALYDPNNSAAGWQLLSVANAQSQSVSFSRPSMQFSLGVGSYEFALVSSAALPSPTPPATGTGILQLDFTNVATPQNWSAVVSVNGTALPVARVTTTSCGGAMCNVVNVQAAAASNANVTAVVYGTVDGTGPPVAFTSALSDIVAAQTTQVAAPVVPVMTSFTATLDPDVALDGAPKDVGIIVHPVGAPGVTSQMFVDVNDNPASFSATVSDPTGQTQITRQPTLSSPGVLHYSGVGSGPSTVTIHSGTLTATATLGYLPSSANSAFAVTTIPRYGAASVAYYPVGASTPVWTATNLYGASGPLAFDANGNVWVQTASGFSGFSSTGTSVGTIAITGENLLTFDRSNLLYAMPAASNVLKVYAINGTSANLVRSLTLPAQIGSAAVDGQGTVYVTTVGGAQSPALYAYPAGSSSPSTWTFNYWGTVETDASGDLFMNWQDSIIEWAAGAPISGSPTRTVFTGTHPYLTGFEVIPNGDGCVQEADSVGQYGGGYALAPWSLTGGSYSVCPQVTSWTSMAATIR